MLLNDETLFFRLILDFWAFHHSSPLSTNCKDFCSTFSQLPAESQVDSSGNFYVAGSTDSSSMDGNSNAGYYDILLMKFDAAGVHQWTTLHGGTGNDYGRALQAKWGEERMSRCGNSRGFQSMFSCGLLVDLTNDVTA